jgi:heme-degrading monooxygenase HmoA
MWLPESPLASKTKESAMFARRVYMHLKPNSTTELAHKLEKEVIPMLRKQKGFQDEITFVAPNGKEAFGISLWESAENAEAYNRGTYPQVAKLLATVIEGTPQVETFEVANSTFHKIAAAVAA